VRVRRPADIHGFAIDRVAAPATRDVAGRDDARRLGWIVAPAAVCQDLALVHIDNAITPGGIAQAALGAAVA
jgi:hypothetical protein